MTTLPKPVVDLVREGRAFLFLGTGASIGAIHPKGINPPTGEKLAEIITEKFLGNEFKKHPLAQVAELAISEYDLITVQDYIASIYRDFNPADFHKLIPRFVWSGIATTNYDLIIERAYNAIKDPCQHLVVFKKDGERIEEKLRIPNSVMYLKLHGCISDIDNPLIPLILTPEQYITHRQGRKRLFEKLQDFAYEYPFIFSGYSLSDIDIRAILHELSQLADARPRSYIVTPNITSAEAKFWEGRKITHIPLSFKDFINELDSSIPSTFRVLSAFRDKPESPINKYLNIPKDVSISESLSTLLGRDVEHVHKEFKTEKAEPKAFYKGYFVDWSPIAENLDVKRSLTDTVLAEVILASEEERRETCEFFVIKGHAGSGKSVILKRIAWEAAVQFDKLCLFVKQASFIDFEPISELYRLSRERIFLFIDPVTECAEIIEDFIPMARKEKIPLTIISGERTNQWNISCTHLDAYVTGTYDVPYLNEKEIEELIYLLTKHKSLGHLNGKSVEEQKEELGKRAGRQLLVALHEATMGKPFSDIVFDEYNSISSQRARSLYLTVCVFNRLNIPVRAGLVSRIHGIPFSEFEARLFKPLESIVFAKMNNLIKDFEYRTRHSHIAEIVFERVLVDARDRFDEYIRIINAVDIDYSADRDGFKGITNYRELMSLFRDPQMVRQIYQAARGREAENPMLLQQEALFEMHSTNGNLEKASDLLQRAYKQAPFNKALAHSLSELALKKAESSSSDVEKSKYLQEAKKISAELIAKGTVTAHPYHTLIKAELIELEELITTGDDVSIERKTKDIEKSISSIVQTFPDDSFIRDIEARFCELINEHNQALKALERAFAANKRSSYIASRLAKVYVMNGRQDEAVKALNECLEVYPAEKYINFQLAMLLTSSGKTSNADILHHLRRSFTIGDNNYIAQFWYARHIYLDGERDDAMKVFNNLGEVNIDIRTKSEPRGIVMENNSPKRYSGVITKVEASYAFINRDVYQDSIFCHSKFTNEKEWTKLRYNKRVTFELAFNFRGPFAINIREEQY